MEEKELNNSDEKCEEVLENEQFDNSLENNQCEELTEKNKSENLLKNEECCEEEKIINTSDIGRFCDIGITANDIIQAEKQLASLTQEKGER